MSYANFNRIVPTDPNDPLVNLGTQLNANWDEAERLLTAQSQGGALVLNPEFGLEVIDYVNERIQIYDGAAFQVAADIDAAWTAWQPIATKAPIQPKAGFTPRWRQNPLIRLVQISGRVQNGAVPASFGTTTYEISADTGNGIPDAMQPYGGQVNFNNCASTPISPSTSSASYLMVSPNAGNNVKISGRFMGTSDGTSTMQLDRVQWWY